MSEAGVPTILLPAPPGEGAKAQAAKTLTAKLTGTFNRYLRQHAHTELPTALAAATHFYHTVLSDQAGRMGLSPDQRESFYRHAVRLMTEGMMEELHRLTEHPDEFAE